MSPNRTCQSAATSSKKDGGGAALPFAALLEAKGVSLATGGTGVGGAAQFERSRCQGKSLLIVRHTAMLDLKPGDNFRSSLEKKPFA